jgi:parallel beta-helix repeat protein
MRKLMKLLIIIAIIIIGFFIYSSVPEQVHDNNVSGIIMRNQVWSDNILVVGDIIVLPWVTLTILPGTTVVVTANKDINNLVGWETCDGINNYDLLIGIKEEDNYNCGVHFHEPYRDEGHHITIIVLGTLNAIGTEDKRIVFKSDSQNPTIYDWNTLLIFNGILSYANLENYRGLGVPPIGGSVEISHNNLRNIGECGVCANGKVRVLFNNISYAGHELIDMWDSAPIIRQNHLGPNPGNAGIIINGGSPEIVDNVIEGCEEGIAFNSPPKQPIVENNTFLNNTQDIIHDYPVE